MSDRDGISHGFMPLECRPREVASPEQREADIHADKVMLMIVGAQTADRAQHVDRSVGFIFRQMQPAARQSGKPAQQVTLDGILSLTHEDALLSLDNEPDAGSAPSPA